MQTMGPIKSFGDLQDSILKLRENFDGIIMGRFKLPFQDANDNSPIKQKDLLTDFGKASDDLMMGAGSLKEQECETDEEEEVEKKEKIRDSNSTNS